ncbi:hypothetical protein ACJIZ3_012530 [Penstemon smallii]|uniref:HTH myb-type domain-containing protein n=1 Tax=Penstemon smallii TaxID=265156 RepID=A0ABD3UQK0_9LAMI
MCEEASRIDDGIADWEAGLPSAADLPPLSQSLIPPELASAFKISPEPIRTMLDVNRASHTTFSSLRGPTVDDQVMEDSECGGSDPKKSRRAEDEGIENFGGCEQGKAVKRPRLVWTPQLHKRFVDVVAHLGLKNAVPKTIMQLMNVEGLTRENVASHLQKYRLYVKRMQGLSDEGPSPSDHLFASTPLPSFNESSSGNGGNNSHNNSNKNSNHHVGMQMMMGNVNSEGGFHHHHHHHHHYQQQYGNMMEQQRDWSGNKFNTNNYSRHVTQNNK